MLYNKREDCTENSIYQVLVKNQRIGWIFPVQALLSRDHDYAKNSFFLKYAYVAICLLLEQIEDKTGGLLMGLFILKIFMRVLTTF